MKIRKDCYKDRSGNIHKKDALAEMPLRFMYTSVLGRAFLKVLGSKTCAIVVQSILDNPVSALFIDPFIKNNNISLKDYIPTKYSSFNDFFTREIRPDRRKLERGEDNLISPSDGKITVCKINANSRFKVKNSVYTVSSLLRDKKRAEEFRNGWFVLVRLSVDNYHHYIYPISGHQSKERGIKGFLHSVNPVVSDYVKVYKENSRNYCTITTGNGISVIQMEVGAMGVGKICNKFSGEADVVQGMKKGHFEFGGSSIILLLPENSYVPDKDLIENSADGFETLVKLGEKIGSR